MTGNCGLRKTVNVPVIEDSLYVDLIRKRAESRTEYQRYLRNKVYLLFKAFIAFLQFLLRCHSVFLLDIKWICNTILLYHIFRDISI